MGRSVRLPEGSPTRPVAPPTRAYVLWPYLMNHSRMTSPTRWPWRYTILDTFIIHERDMYTVYVKAPMIVCIYRYGW